MESDRKLIFRGGGVIAIGVAIQWCALLGPLPDWIAIALGQPGSEEGDLLVLTVAKGISAFLGLLLTLLFAALIWKRSRTWAMNVVYLSWIFATPTMIQALYVLGRCLKAMEPTQAQAVLDDYFRPSFQRGTFHVGILSGFVIWMGALAVQWFLARRRARPDAAKAEEPAS